MHPNVNIQKEQKKAPCATSTTTTVGRIDSEVMLVDDERQNLQNASRTALRYGPLARVGFVCQCIVPFVQTGNPQTKAHKLRV